MRCFVVVISSASSMSSEFMSSIWIHVIDLPAFFMVTSLALGQSCDCPSASEVILKDMDIIGQHPTTAAMCVFLGMYWSSVIDGIGCFKELNKPERAFYGSHPLSELRIKRLAALSWKRLPGDIAINITQDITLHDRQLSLDQTNCVFIFVFIQSQLPCGAEAWHH